MDLGSSAPQGSIDSARLIMRVLQQDVVLAITNGIRMDDWAEDYPADGDRAVAQFLKKEAPGDKGVEPWVHYQVVERSTDEVIGGIGFKGPPDDDREVEIGYGIVPSRQGFGYATEAVLCMADFAFRQDRLSSIVAKTDPDNVASRRVLEKSGFEEIGRDGYFHYRLEPS